MSGGSGRGGKREGEGEEREGEGEGEAREGGGARTSCPQSTSLIVEYWWEGTLHCSPIVNSRYLLYAARKLLPSVLLARWQLLSTHRRATASSDAVH